MATPFFQVADRFKRIITEPLYADLPIDIATEDLNSLVMDSVFSFEFPKHSLAYDEENETFLEDLTLEEINLLARFMLESWLDRYINNAELVRVEYGDKDFKIGGQGAILNAAINSKASMLSRTKYLMRLYNRRDNSGNPNYSELSGGAFDE